MFLLFSLALLIPAVGAHVPHDPLLNVMPPADLDPDRPWYAIGDHGERSLLHKGSGFGPTGWTVIGGEPTGDLLVDGCQMDDGTVVLVSTDRLWWSDDQAATWSWQEIFAPVHSVLCAPQLLVATSSGVFTGELGDELEAEIEEYSVESLFAGPGGDVAVASLGTELFVRAEDAWRGIPATDTRVRSAVVASDGAVYAGDDSGAVWRYDGDDWQACGVLPDSDLEGLSYPHVLAMAAQDDLVMAVAAWRGPFVSDDDCASWQDLHAEMYPYFEGSGHCSSVTMAFTDLFVAGDRWALSGWDGLALSEDAGLSRVEPFLIAPDYARGLAFSPAYFEDAGVFVGAYAAGVTRSGDGGQSFESASWGLAAPNVQRLSFPPDNTDDSPMYAITGHVLWRGDDGGSRWTLLAPPQEQVASLAFLDEPPRIWAIGPPSGADGVRAAESLDQGRSWRALENLEQGLGDSALLGAAQVVAEDGSLVTCCVKQAPAGVVCLYDDGESWESSWSGGEELLTRPVAWPVDQPTRLLFAADNGIVWTDDPGDEWQEDDATERERILLLEPADDGTLFAATTGGLVLRSDDGGESWVELPLRLPASLYALASHPSFGSSGHLLVGTHDGPFLVLDAWSDQPTWGYWGGHNLVDDFSNYVERVGLGEPEDYPGQRLTSVGRILAGGSMRTGLRGATLWIHGAVQSVSVVEVYVDGELVGNLGSQANPTSGCWPS